MYYTSGLKEEKVVWTDVVLGVWSEFLLPLLLQSTALRSGEGIIIFVKYFLWLESRQLSFTRLAR